MLPRHASQLPRPPDVAGVGSPLTNPCAAAPTGCRRSTPSPGLTTPLSVPFPRSALYLSDHRKPAAPMGNPSARPAAKAQQQHPPDAVDPLHDQHLGARQVAPHPRDLHQRVPLKVGVEILRRGRGEGRAGGGRGGAEMAGSGAARAAAAAAITARRQQQGRRQRHDHQRRHQRHRSDASQPAAAPPTRMLRASCT